MKTVTLLSSALIVLYACTGATGNNAEKGMNSGIAGASPDSINIRNSELKRYAPAIKIFADSVFKNGSLNGALLVAKDGQILYEQYGGFADYKARRDSINANSAFHLASVSKTITAMAILKLWQDGKLDIEDTITRFLPQFPRKDVTIKTLLNHRSGLPNYVHYMDRLGWDKRKRVSNQDVLDFIVSRHKEIDIGPADRRFSYSNTNYALLALIIEKASGVSYADYLKQAFFSPLGMSHSYVFQPSDSARAMPSFFHNGRQYAFDFLDIVYGDKNIYSTAQDLLKFDVALSSGLLIHPRFLEAAFTPYSFEKPGTHNYGLGWRMLLLKNGKKLIYHNGWWHGNRTAFYHLADEKVTIVALCNNDSKRVYSVRKLADLFGDYLQTGDKDEDGESVVESATRSPKKHKSNLTRRRANSDQSIAAKK